MRRNELALSVLCDIDAASVISTYFFSVSTPHS